MEITVQNSDNPQVTECFAETSNDSLSIHINTKDRWVNPDYTSVGHKFGDHAKQQIEFIFECGDRVSVVSETDEEYDYLRSIRFECHCKDQLWYYFPKEFIRNKNEG